jgi:SAM-dependent methyltransferase
VVGWFDGEESQKNRFNALLYLFKYLPRQNKFSLLDLGCGLGDFYKFLKGRGFLSQYRIKYTGFDISSKMIKKCKQRFPGVNFQVKDILEGKRIPIHDIVLASGIFNLKLANRRSENLKWVFKILRRMFNISHLGVAADFQNKKFDKLAWDKRVKHWCSYDMKEIIEMCERITPNFILQHCFMPFDSCVFLLK